ncbi:LytTR family DNA-binding domain-containing protein [Thalassotalea nanhaiensis]|uniref:LytTR family DNA-binding domain-containing protein n=1 Tax=Thalassotalea nanhaiensis TaxID=3065648 RepID=A0ABY9TEF9_9GAMM|nr:LytTR family DNA-binding domain-containing protein [Colwelliaceae bacterium SQ345]
MNIKVVLIDDEPMAHEVILHHLKRHKDFQVIAQCYNAVEALQVLANNTVDLVFLDVSMPALSGIDMLKLVHPHPSVIIVSAHPEYAIDGFELDVVDYLLKPVNEERFDHAISKFMLAKNIESHQRQSLTLKVGRRLEKVDISNIIFLESYGNYVKVWTNSDMILANSTLKSLLKELSSSVFTQINKSVAINMEKVKGIEGRNVTLCDGQIKKTSKMFVENAKSLMNN